MDLNCSLVENVTKETISKMGTSVILNYSSLYRIISLTINIILFLVGIVGNILVVIVVIRTRSMRTPTNCYLMSLAIADCLVLMSATLPAIPETFYQINEWPFGRVMCSLLVFLQYLGVDTSALSITAFTMERYIAICHPLRSQTMCTVKRAKRIIAVIWIFGILYCSPWLGLTVLLQQQRKHTVVDVCQVRLKREQYTAYYMTDLILFYIVPLLIAAVLYGLIARILFKTNISQESSEVIMNRKRCRKRQVTARMQVVRMLAVIVFVFMTTWMPYRTMVVYNSIAQKKYLDPWFLMFCRTMAYINSAINPILYNAMSVKFRRAFKRILCCGHGGNEPHLSVYSEINMENAMILSRRNGSVSKIQMHLAFNGRSQSADRNGTCTGTSYLQTGNLDGCRIK
ncbi:thyrotropin-releasing hormone receptor-like [Ruditapes philippinarum]|uniref:thyrotropin-releasing hormone receptor-like n=1 Tax=Ruditapes philippinarum TaxID=129788 RepID=UPI00295B74D0|nr:thyrotropin-releasing hormone receptor-like [Ruditapes philippinarum]